MLSKATILALCAAASVKEVAAGPFHRHIHPKREIVWAETDTVVVTDYVTMTVTAGEEGPTAEAVPTSSSAEVEAASEPTTSLASPTTLPTTSPAAAVPTSAPTTIVTVVKSSSSSAVETPTTSSVAVASPVVHDTPTTTAQASVAAVASTTSSAAAAESSVTTSSTSSSSTGKRGAAYNDASLVSTVLGLGGKLSWAYNWTPDPNGLKDSVMYYPMLWSTGSDHSTGWDTKAEAAIARGSTAFLSFNEPDISSQANMSPADAAAGHKQYFAKYAGKVKISSPAISSSESSGQGIDWLNQFFTACNGECQVDFCAAHWYGPGGTDGATLFLNHITKVHEACENKNVWVTEFAAQSGDVNTFMKTVVDKLESDDYSFVEKYSYFWLSEGSLMNSTSTLSDFGEIFAGTA
ncbi:glycoside hydrolase family 128 protein [Annulohypoxylon maeteangense]|uniref:glycoside hydrolase family 128 protein n=1 Tax=Annulohypoxylon maeteangense TaxID=1927788 RepID=UPI0020080E78|nr:glycoside hydrolase family 128 protein [Annulohypoxylon maeteangense]KAI0882490.1 glycoside hydrolase family 128 protein [Annulohypoxylon maeteangense]